MRDFERLCSEHALDPKQVVFLFPGNISHHQTGTNLFSIKTGGGLANLAREIGQKGYPVLSLPTTTMENWDKDAAQQRVVQKAITDLYRARGAGYHFMLPVRDHKQQLPVNHTQHNRSDENIDDQDCLLQAARACCSFFFQAARSPLAVPISTSSPLRVEEQNTPCYFTNGLKYSNFTKEPSFWGGIQKASNIPLADHYITQLDSFHDFVALSDTEQQSLAKSNTSNPFWAAYLNGNTMQPTDPWLQSPHQAFEHDERRTARL